MGEVKVDIILENEKDIIMYEENKLTKEEIRSIKTKALVDTGAVMILLPQDMVEKLGLTEKGKVIVTLANEEKVEMKVAGILAITIAGRRWETDCLIGPPQSEPLVGQLVLERLDLIVDSLKQMVVSRPESPYLPSLKLK